LLTAIIVDDEGLSVQRLHRLLAESDEIGVCHTFLDPKEAYSFARENRVDVAFLDISMPEVDGMTLSSQLQALDESIRLVFVTGYSEYAVQAFDVRAVDYLLKPVTAARLNRTLDRIVRWNSVNQDTDHDAAPAVETRLFDGLTISIRGQGPQPIKLRSPKTEELFAYLVCKGTVSRDEVVETLWSGLEPVKAWKNLNSTLYYIRKTIDKDESNRIIQTGKSEIRVDAGGMFCDLYEFDSLMKQIRLYPEPHENLLRQAEALYEGRLLAGKSYEWSEGIAHKAERDYIEVMEKLARRCLTQDRPTESLAYFNRILALDNAREDIHYAAIRLYSQLGCKQEALKQYRVIKELLRKNHGIGPDPKIEAFMAQMS